MGDVIKLLPDSVINQIAAGEVIQRPASAVKELLENAVDSGATKIKLIIKDSGKTLIRVIDNGCGMSDTDARLCFDKHATSKISTAEDIFSILTKGFRGEALASIAAISSVELKTRKPENEVGCHVEIEYSKFIKQEPCQCEAGTSISVRNLFFNVPARKIFLKSDTVEFRHIMEEFHRIALAHPELEFTFFNEEEKLFHLIPGNLKQRIMALFGSNYDSKTVPVAEKTDLVNISGFIGKPEYARKTRGEQYFFVNRRFIKNNYLHHALQTAYIELLSKDSYPSYFVFFDIKPSKIDVNIHPTKTEIKFENESFIYAILKSSIKRALGQYNVIAPMDFDQEGAFPISPVKSGTVLKQPTIQLNPDYNPFAEETKGLQRVGLSLNRDTETLQVNNPSLLRRETPVLEEVLLQEEKKHFNWHQNWNKEYMVVSYLDKLLLINQRLAWEKIFFEEGLESLEKSKHMPFQKELFPQTIQFSASDAVIVLEIINELKCLGFEINDFGKQTFIIYGVPVGIDSGSVQNLIEGIIENYKYNQSKDIKNPRNLIIAKSYASRMAASHLKLLSLEERESLLERLFLCQNPGLASDSKKVYVEVTPENLDKLF